MQHTGDGELIQFPEIKGTMTRGDADVEGDQADQQDEAAESEIDRRLPGGGLAVARSPDTDHQEGRDQGQFVEGVEEEDVE